MYSFTLSPAFLQKNGLFGLLHLEIEKLVTALKTAAEQLENQKDQNLNTVIKIARTLVNRAQDEFDLCFDTARSNTERLVKGTATYLELTEYLIYLVQELEKVVMVSPALFAGKAKVTLPAKNNVFELLTHRLQYTLIDRTKKYFLDYKKEYEIILETVKQWIQDERVIKYQQEVIPEPQAKSIHHAHLDKLLKILAKHADILELQNKADEKEAQETVKTEAKSALLFRAFALDCLDSLSYLYGEKINLFRKCIIFPIDIRRKILIDNTKNEIKNIMPPHTRMIENRLINLLLKNIAITCSHSWYGKNEYGDLHYILLREFPHIIRSFVKQSNLEREEGLTVQMVLKDINHYQAENFSYRLEPLDYSHHYRPYYRSQL